MPKAILIDIGGPLVDDHDFYAVTDRLTRELPAYAQEVDRDEDPAEGYVDYGNGK